ncbi:hypothetical protein [Verminephrobacter aporrectodeae]|uniref:hypothetical protein n=1 Tax=Verminephrobacter aporrectodeae TaxID=1110389 RepID=UPI00224333E0|nr:hypothetical protein [Verminephrobacter aporrectodeae]
MRYQAFVLTQATAGCQWAQQICWMNLPTQVPDCANPGSYDDFYQEKNLSLDYFSGAVDDFSLLESLVQNF